MAHYLNRIKDKAERLLKSPDKEKEFPKAEKDDKTMKDLEAALPKETEKKTATTSKTPSKEQIEKWTMSIEYLLQDPDGFSAFQEFLLVMENETGEEGEHTKYLDFYQECQDYKAEFKRLEDRAKDIFQEYLAIGATREVGTGGKSVDIGDKLEDSGLEGVTLFDEAIENAVHKMEKVPYVQFCRHYKEKFKL